MSARDLVIPLEGVYKNQRDFPIYLGSLVIPRQQKVWRGVMAAQHPRMEEASIKTGHISTPKSVYTLAGYFSL